MWEIAPAGRIIINAVKGVSGKDLRFHQAAEARRSATLREEVDVKQGKQNRKSNSNHRREA